MPQTPDPKPQIPNLKPKNPKPKTQPPQLSAGGVTTGGSIERNPARASRPRAAAAGSGFISHGTDSFHFIFCVSGVGK